MTIAVIPTVRTITGTGQTGLPIVDLNWTAATVLSSAPGGTKSGVFFTQLDGMVELSADAQCWFTVAGFSTTGASAGAGVAVPGSAVLTAGVYKQVYVPVNAIIGAMSLTSANLAIVPAYQTT
jgi:hypothetical protein